MDGGRVGVTTAAPSGCAAGGLADLMGCHAGVGAGPEAHGLTRMRAYSLVLAVALGPVATLGGPGVTSPAPSACWSPWDSLIGHHTR